MLAGAKAPTGQTALEKGILPRKNVAAVDLFVEKNSAFDVFSVF